MITCAHCKREVLLNQIVRSAHHDLGCVFCYGKPEAETPVMAAEKIVARTTGKLAAMFGAERS